MAVRPSGGLPNDYRRVGDERGHEFARRLLSDDAVVIAVRAAGNAEPRVGALGLGHEDPPTQTLELLHEPASPKIPAVEFTSLAEGGTRRITLGAPSSKIQEIAPP